MRKVCGMADSGVNRLFGVLHRAGILKNAVTADTRENTGKPLPRNFGLAAFIGTAGGAGYAPFAQGTFGSLIPPVMTILAPGSWIERFWAASWIVVALAVLVYFAGVWASGVCEKVWGHDPGRVVIDEVAGTLVTLAFLPLSPIVVWTGFFLFRVFDIFKPWPVRRFERCRAGWGVMNDDIAAGIYANIVLRLVVAIMVCV